jgi:hypothetical protein
MMVTEGMSGRDAASEGLESLRTLVDALGREEPEATKQLKV